MFSFPTLSRSLGLRSQISCGIIYLYRMPTRRVKERACAFAPEVSTCEYTRAYGTQGGEAPPGVNMCSITYAIDNPFDESLAANKGDGRREREAGRRSLFLARSHAMPFHERRGRSRLRVPRPDTIFSDVTHPPVGVATTSRTSRCDVRRFCAEIESVTTMRRRRDCSHGSVET